MIIPICTRFAPSPTGSLHIGGVRTALYSWLYSKKHQGKFILRIEDTDSERSTDQAIQVILEGMAWLKLDYDKGPIYQTQRFSRYQAVATQLLAEEKAYYCYCSAERLTTMRAAQIANKQKPRYDRTCRELTQQFANQPYVIRFKNPLAGTVIIQDAIHGTLSFENAELDDLIIARSDHTPTYNFTVVVDDWDMGITHVIRGDDHINNTPRQVNILRALEATLPIYAHVPMILGPDGKRLSKRNGAISILQYREEGILPEALLNYLARLGWSYGDQEIFSISELIQYFDIQAVNRSSAIFDPNKLLWLNQHYLKISDLQTLSEELAWHFQRLAISIEQGPALIEVVQAQRKRVKTLREMAEKSRYFYEEITYIPNWKSYFPQTIIPVLHSLLTIFTTQARWDAPTLHTLLTQQALNTALPFGQLAQPLRVAVTGGTQSPPIDITLALLGKPCSLQRLEMTLAWLK